MIYAHHFHFAEQPELRREYMSFGFKPGIGQEACIIEVAEMKEYPGFGYRSGLRYLSGQRSYYLSNRELESIGREDDFGLEVVDVLTLVWESGHRRILYGKGEGFTLQRLQFWIYHTFFPLVLELGREYKILHVGAVEIDGGPVFFSAPSYGGKSTLTDYFISKGHTLYADDTLPVRRENGRLIAYPSFPYHRPYRQPETLGYRVDNFAKGPAPLKALFELESAPADAKVEIVVPTGIERFKSCFYSTFIKFKFMKKERFDFFTKMAQEVPVFKVTVPWDMERLDEVYEAIVTKTKEL
jgi:hypothetical protein